MSRARAASLALALVLWVCPTVGAEFDWPVAHPLPSHDIALGLQGGVSFGEEGGRATLGPSGGVTLSYLHGVFGAHLSLSAFPERTGIRLQPLLELSIWYVALVGAGVSVSPFLGEPPPDLADPAITVHATLGLPLALWTDEDAQGEDGSIVITPFARPGLRIRGQGDVSGHHTVGVMLSWTSYTF